MQGGKERERAGARGGLTGNCDEVGGVVRNDELLVQKKEESKNLKGARKLREEERRKGGQRK